MRILICTQAVDLKDPALGFFHHWLEEFSRHAEKITIICLRQGNHSLPPNARVIALSKTSKAGRAFEVCTYAWKCRKDYDAVFVHMNPEYLVTTGWLWALMRKPAFVWYVHRAKNLRLVIASWFAKKVFTVSESTFPYRHKHIKYLGHGIDIADEERKQYSGKGLSIIAVGRITPIKGLDSMVDALAALYETKKDFNFTFVGGPTTNSDEKYLDLLKEKIGRLPFAKHVHFLGPVSHERMTQVFQNANVLLNLTREGSFDKVILEAMSHGVRPVVGNAAFAGFPGVEVVAAGSPQEIARALSLPTETNESMCSFVRENHSLQRLIPLIMREMCTV